MEKKIKTTIFIDKEVRTIQHARQLAKMAEEEVNQLKGELLSLIMSSPKDITPYEEEPLLYLKRNFNKIWGDLCQAFIDKYKYTMIANDAEFEPNSTVQKQWNSENNELERLKEEDLKREKFFKDNKDILNIVDYNDYMIYEKWSKGEIEIPNNFTIKDKEELLKEIERQKEQAHKFRYK